jgi:uncharacterized OB-fold protein
VTTGKDEDAVTMAVAAIRAAGQGERSPRRLLFSSTRPQFLDKGQASIVAVAAGLEPGVRAYDFHGSVRSGVGALVTALDSPGPSVVALADQRFGLPGSPEDLTGADAAVAITVSDDPIATVVATAAVSAPLHDRWRPEGSVATRVWDTRWSADELDPLIDHVVAGVLAEAGHATLDEVDHVVLVSPNPRVGSRLRARTVPVEAPDARVGDAGVAQIGLELAHVLSLAEAGERILLVVAADGAEALLLEAGPALAARRPATPFAPSPTRTVTAGAYLRWRGTLLRDTGRRPDPLPPAAPAAMRNSEWKYALVASECKRCGTNHLPPRRTCFQCGALDEMVPQPLAGSGATIRAFTLDHLAGGDAGPSVIALLEFDKGGRGRFELTDVDPESVQVGDRVAMAFRIASDPPTGPRNYFWKGRPLMGSDD